MVRTTKKDTTPRVSVTITATRMLVYSTAIGATCGLVGMYLSYYAGVPSGTMIVLVGAALFIVVLVISGGRGLRRSAGLDSHSEDLLMERAA